MYGDIRISYVEESCFIIIFMQMTLFIVLRKSLFVIKKKKEILIQRSEKSHFLENFLILLHNATDQTIISRR